MDETPFTIGELVAILKEFPQDHELRFMGEDEEQFFFRFKQRGENVQIIEFRERLKDD